MTQLKSKAEGQKIKPRNFLEYRVGKKRERERKYERYQEAVFKFQKK